MEAYLYLLLPLLKFSHNPGTDRPRGVPTNITKSPKIRTRSRVDVLEAGGPEWIANGY